MISKNPERNDFLAINQFRVDVPGGKTFIAPDIVLFVNGIPIVVVECKSPKITNPMEEWDLWYVVEFVELP
ncbi:MAG: hypothetical protein KAV87_26305 [Desulfobacteraceae bacterium]|nr:hypothetical protein [Desulfobacteraceae bacterium]